MAKKMQKAFSCILALSLCVSLLSVGAWAEEGSMITTTGSGTAQDPEITITITREDPVQDEETGESRQTTRTEKTWEGTTPEGAEPGQEGTVTTVGVSRPILIVLCEPFQMGASSMVCPASNSLTAS